MKKITTNILYGSMTRLMSILILFAGLTSSTLIAGEKIEAQGEIQALTATSITVDDTEFEVNVLTKVYTKSGSLFDYGELTTGQEVKVIGEVVLGVNISQKIILLDDEGDDDDTQEIEVKGELTALSETSLTVDGTDFTINSETQVLNNNEEVVDFSFLSVGQTVEVKGYTSADANIATQIKIEDEDDGDDDSTSTELEVKGELTALSETSLTVDGTDFTINSETQVLNNNEEVVDFSFLSVGQTVEVKGYATADANIATQIKIEDDDDDSTDTELEVKGEITELSATSLTVDGTSFTINSETQVLNDNEEMVDFSFLSVGQTVEVKGYATADANIATQIKVEDGEDDDEQELEVKGEITAFSETSLTVGSTSFTVNSETQILNDNEEVVEFSFLSVGQTVEVKGYATADANIATQIKVEDGEDDDSTDTELEVKGEISAISETSLTVESTTFTLNEDTKVLVEGVGYAELNYLTIGLLVEVKGYVSGELNIARIIKVERDEDDSDDDSSDIHLEAEGEITALTENSITVNGINFTINSSTLVFMKGKAELSDLQLGQMVEVKGYTFDSENFAMLIKIEMEDNKGIDIDTEGEISELSEGSLSVNDMTFTLNSQTLVVLEESGKVDLSYLEVGQTIEIKAYVTGGENIAKIIKIKHEANYTITVTGEITEKDSNSLTVNDTKFLVDSETEFYADDETTLTFDDFEAGMFVKIKGNSNSEVNIALEVYLKEKAGMQQKEQVVNFIEEETLVVGDQIYHVNSNTEVYGSNGFMMSYFELEIGMEVEVVENIEGGLLFASKVTILSSTADVESNLLNNNLNVMSYPNPFEQNTNVKFNLSNASNVSLVIFDVTGAKVKEVFAGELGAGEHALPINLDSNYGTGMYYAQLVVNGQFYSTVLVKGSMTNK